MYRVHPLYTMCTWYNLSTTLLSKTQTYWVPKLKTDVHVPILCVKLFNSTCTSHKHRSIM